MTEFRSRWLHFAPEDAELEVPKVPEGAFGTSGTSLLGTLAAELSSAKTEFRSRWLTIAPEDATAGTFAPGTMPPRNTPGDAHLNGYAAGESPYTDPGTWCRVDGHLQVVRPDRSCPECLSADQIEREPRR